QSAAGTERVIDRAVRDAGPLRYRADRDGLDAALDREFLGRIEHRIAVVHLWPGHDGQDNRAAALLSTGCVTRRGNAGASNLRRRRVVLWHIGSSSRTAKGERPFRARLTTPTREWVIVPSPGCGGSVGNGPPRRAAAFPPKPNASSGCAPRSTRCWTEGRGPCLALPASERHCRYCRLMSPRAGLGEHPPEVGQTDATESADRAAGALPELCAHRLLVRP